MRGFLCALIGIGVLGLPLAVRAVSITGIMIYSTDDAGMPTGFDFDRPEVDRGQLWRTAVDAHWYGLGVMSGFPPESLQGTPLNAPDFSVLIPLAEGNNDFTLLGEPGPLSETDAYQRFALNLFLDGKQDNPAISVLFARGAARYGAPPVTNESDIVLGMPVTPVSLTPQAVYDDGTMKVSVGAVSFLPPRRWLDVDLISAHELVPSADGAGDWVGVLEVMVEGVADDGATSRPQAFGGRGGDPAIPGVRVGPDLSGGALAGESSTGLPPASSREGAIGWHSAERGRAAHGDPTPDPEQTQTAAETATAAGSTMSKTPSPAVSPSPTRNTTATPAATVRPTAVPDVPASASPEVPVPDLPKGATPPAQNPSGPAVHAQ